MGSYGEVGDRWPEWWLEDGGGQVVRDRDVRKKHRDLPCYGLRLGNCDCAADMTGADGISRFAVSAIMQAGADRLHLRTTGGRNSGRPAKAGQDDQYDGNDQSHGSIIYQSFPDWQITMMCRVAAMGSA